MTMLADKIRLHASAAGLDPLRVKEIARTALPEATERVNEAWRLLLETPREDPHWEGIRDAHLSAAIEHVALAELAE